MVGLAIQASESLVEVGILELLRFPCAVIGILSHQHRTGAGDSEGIRPETDTGNGLEAIN